MTLPTLKKLDPSIPWGELARKRLNDLIDLIVDAGDTEPGLIEIATDAEAQAKTATDKALVPSNLAALGSSETFAGLVELATTAEATTGTDTARAVTPAGVKAVADSITSIGKHKLWIPVEVMQAQTTNGPGAANVTASEVQYRVFDFDQTTIEYAHFAISMPSSWDEGTVTVRAVWTAASGTGGVTWRFNGLARSDDDAIAGSYSTSVFSKDTLIAAGDLHRAAESTALTIDGSPAANDTVFFRIGRDPTDGDDTLNADARLLGVELYYTTDAAVDVST